MCTCMITCSVYLYLCVSSCVYLYIQHIQFGIAFTIISFVLLVGRWQSQDKLSLQSGKQCETSRQMMWNDSTEPLGDFRSFIAVCIILSHWLRLPRLLIARWGSWLAADGEHQQIRQGISAPCFVGLRGGVAKHLDLASVHFVASVFSMLQEFV